MGSVLRTLTIISRVKIPRKMYIQMSIAFFSCNVRKLLWGLPSVRKGIMKFFSWLDQVFKFGLKSFGMRCSFSRRSVLTSQKVRRVLKLVEFRAGSLITSVIYKITGRYFGPLPQRFIKFSLDYWSGLWTAIISYMHIIISLGNRTWTDKKTCNL